MQLSLAKLDLRLVRGMKTTLGYMSSSDCLYVCLVTLRSVFFQGDGSGDGIRTHDTVASMTN